MRPRQKRGTIQFKPKVYGKTRLGSPLEIWLPTDEVQVLLLAGIHGAEPESTLVLSRAFRMLEEQSAHCAVILTANPDGLIRGTRCNASGVDLNRNFPTGNWQSGPVNYRWTLGDPRDVELSPGKSPGSEPETQAILALVKELSPAYITAVHAPLACIDDPHATELGQWFSDRSGLELVADVGYPTPGSFGSWALENAYELITYELPDAPLETLVEEHSAIFYQLLTDPSIIL